MKNINRADAMNGINKLHERVDDRKDRIWDVHESHLRRDSDEKNDTTTPTADLFYESCENLTLIGM